MKYYFTKCISIFFVIAMSCFLLSFNNQSLNFNESYPIATVDTIAKTEYYLEMKGNVRESKGTIKDETLPLDSALVTIYMDNVPRSEIMTNKKGKCAFKLPLDKVFKIEVSKKGYVTKYFEVSTKVPFDKKDIYSFAFDIDLFEDIKGLDVSVLKKPVAKVTFNQFLVQFAYDVSYTSKINAELKKMYKNYYTLQKIDADTSLFSPTQKDKPQPK